MGKNGSHRGVAEPACPTAHLDAWRHPFGTGRKGTNSTQRGGQDLMLFFLFSLSPLQQHIRNRTEGAYCVPTWLSKILYSTQSPDMDAVCPCHNAERT